MKVKINKGIKTNWIKAAVIGSVCALVITAVLTALLSVFTLNGSIGESGMGYAIFAIRLISVAVGGLIGTGISEEKMLPIVGVVTAGYLAALVAIGIALFNGSFNQFGSGLLSAVLGGAAAGAIQLKPKKNKHRFLPWTR